MGKKYLTFSFDDGLTQDRKIVELMHKYGLKGTFNLNAGLFGLPGEVKGIRSFALWDVPRGTKHFPIFSYAAHDRIPKEEALTLYAGMEIASHSYKHEFLNRIPEAEMRESLDRDIAELEEMTGKKILGHAYPKSATSPEIRAHLKNKGVIYGRTALPTGKFAFPEDPLDYAPSCMLAQGNAVKLIHQFDALSAEEDTLLLMWGHGYEFDYGTKGHDWKELEHIFSEAAQCGDCIFCTNAEAFSHI
ncbi:MAG: polysaccharide deacetylase family protein [Lachnospiraceae bacterium]|nr:polysaccharide deacetylase family protein [Lachnospiraceae bacterium]